MSCGNHFHRLTTSCGENWFNSLLNMTPSGFTCCSLVTIHENIFFPFFHPVPSFIDSYHIHPLLSAFLNHSLIFLGKQSSQSELSYCHSENLNSLCTEVGAAKTALTGQPWKWGTFYLPHTTGAGNVVWLQGSPHPRTVMWCLSGISCNHRYQQGCRSLHL